MPISSIDPSLTPQENPSRVERAQRQDLAVKEQLNVRILQASAKVSLTAGNQEQALLFRAAIESINETLAPEFGPDAIGRAAGQDFSPQAVADRIVNLSTAFFDSYAKQHPGEDPEKLASNFVDLIRGGFEKGFNEARNILEGLQVFSGSVKDGVMETYSLVNQGYDRFLADKLAALQPEKPAEEK